MRSASLAATRRQQGEEAAEAIHIEDLHKKFGDLHVLKGVSLSARDGEVVAIIGGSGSGKSTLLRCINCLENPTSGLIRVNGEEIRLKPDGHGGSVPADRRQIERIRSRLGMVFQSFNLWSHMTLLENVIEVPIHVLGFPTSGTSTRPSCPAASSSAGRSLARWPSTRASCCSTNPLRRSTPNSSARC
jgi:octopine/nopaline transport system ATP-binding protein